MADSLNLRKSLGVSRAGQLVAATYSGATNTTLPGNLTVQGVVSNNVSGSLLLRAYDETGVFSSVTNVTGNPLPAAFSGRPVSALQTSSVNYTNATFSGLSQGYSLRISGYVKPPTTGTTTFRLTCQDGGRLFVGLGKLLNTWTFLSSTYVGTATVAMTAGAWLPITIEHSASTATERLLLEFSLDGTTFNTFTHGTTSGAFKFMYDSAEAGPSQLGTNYVTGKAYHNDIAYFNQGLSLPNATIVTGKVSELTNDVGYVTPQGTVTGTALNITGQYASVSGNLVASTVTATTLNATSANVTGTLSVMTNVISSSALPTAVWTVANGSSLPANTATRLSSSYYTLFTQTGNGGSTLMNSSGYVTFPTKGIYYINFHFCLTGQTSSYRINFTSQTTNILIAEREWSNTSSSISDLPYIGSFSASDSLAIFFTNNSSSSNSFYSVSVEPTTLSVYLLQPLY